MEIQLACGAEAGVLPDIHDNLLNAECCCRLSITRLKQMEIATDEANTPIKQDVKKGKLRDYPYNIHWNYGCLPQTWEAWGRQLPAHPASAAPSSRIQLASCHAAHTSLPPINPQDPAHENKELGVKGDNDPVDVVEIGSVALASGSVTPVRHLLPQHTLTNRSRPALASGLPAHPARSRIASAGEAAWRVRHD